MEYHGVPLSKEEERCLLIEMITSRKYIKLSEMIKGWYFTKGRNFKYAYWDGEHFHGMRHKWGQLFSATELHWDSDSHYGTVKPIKRLSE